MQGVESQKLRVACVLFGIAATALLLVVIQDRLVPGPTSRPAVNQTVVLVTLDGVRPLELLSGADPLQPGVPGAPIRTAMPFLMEELVPRGTFLGDVEAGSPFGLGSPMGISIPSYQSMFFGPPIFCVNNECLPPERPNLFERLHDGLALERDQLVMLVSYGPLCGGVGVTPESRAADATCGRENLARGWQAVLGGAGESGSDEPPTSADQAVIDLALHRLRVDPPLLLYVSFNDSDSAGHADDYPRYLRELARYDGWLRLLYAEIERLRAGGRQVTMLVTTDHGRGRGPDWKEHLWTFPGTGELWLFAVGDGIADKGRASDHEAYSLNDLGPTIEHLLGLAPVRGILQGQVIEEVLADHGVIARGASPGE